MKSIIYPAIFYKLEDGYYVEFPNLPGCLTEGDNLIEAFNMAGDVLYLWAKCNLNMPKPSKFEDIKVEGDNIKLLVKACKYKKK